MSNFIFNKWLLYGTLVFASTIYSCDDKRHPTPDCYKGTVLGKIRSSGGGLAVSVNSTAFGKHEWGGYRNVVEALNLKSDYSPGTTIYFKARAATEQEKIYIITADGNESAKPVVYMTAVSAETCPE